jgi:hypothetical protein
LILINFYSNLHKFFGIKTSGNVGKYVYLGSWKTEIPKLLEMKKSPFIIWFVLLLFLVNSCNYDSLDFNKLSREVNLNPSFVAPIAKANITVWDLVQSGNKDMITKDANGLIKIVYKQTDLFKFKISDYIDFPKHPDYNVSISNFEKQLIKFEGGFDMNVEMLDKIDGPFTLANPKLQLTIHNSIGMPASMGLEMSATNKSKSVVLKRLPPEFNIPVPANLAEGIRTDSIEFNKDNSNIVEFISLPPTGKILYSGKLDFNTTVTPQNPKFLDRNATFAIDMVMELPIELKISNLAFKDTTSITGNNFDKLETAELIINAKNGIPLDVDLQLFFVDTISGKQFGTSKKTKILTAAQVNGSGVITPSQSSNTFGLDKSEMENLRKANGIVFVGSISSPSGGATVAPILWDSKIELNVVIKSKVNLTDLK